MGFYTLFVVGFKSVNLTTATAVYGVFMKKKLKTLLLTLSFACMTTAVGCSFTQIEVPAPVPEQSESDTGDNSSSQRPEGTLKATFKKGEGYTIVSDLAEGELVPAGDVIDFSVKMSAFYTGYPVVYINGKAIAPDDNGVYHVEMEQDIEVTVGGVQKDVSNMAGTGSFEDAFVVSKPIDLVYIAEQVNKGVYEYVTGAYVLANDIDCGGEELQVIGDMSTENSFFSGCFTCYTNADTGEMQAYTISNFTINSSSANYVGLFGTVYSDVSVTSSGLFYGINLDNFVINARLDNSIMTANRSISVGSLIGYGVGANVYLCTATNGEINLYGDTNYFSFAGGLVGYQQAFYMADYDMNFPSEIVYSTTDVNIRVLQGMALYAGGISGYLATNAASGATAFIHNSYARGNVSGALRSGGIAGGLGQYTSIGNCYATGAIHAKADQGLDDVLLTDDQYCYASAGGIVGYAENDTIVSDCFFAGTTSANSVSAGCTNLHDIIADGSEKGYASASAQKYQINNCLTSADLKETASDNNTLFKNTFGWANFDWVFKASDYPTINLTSSEETQTASVTFRYVANGEAVKVDGETTSSITYFNTDNQSLNVYAPMGNYFLTGGFKRTLRADNDYLSYGYFFDAECTQKVPYSYVPQRNIELYIGFANPESLLGQYQLVHTSSAKDLTLSFDNNGYATYSDGTTQQTSYYFFDGTQIIIEGARLARYYDGAIIVDENDTSSLGDTAFDLYRYNYYDFVGSIENGEISLFDGTYFTAENPLRAKKNLFRGEYHLNGAIYTFYGETATMEQGAEFTAYTYVKNGNNLLLTDANGNTSVINVDDLQAFDQFKGVWTKSATVNKTYYFDGMGGWSYEYATKTSGTYEVLGDKLCLNNGTIVSFDSDGNLSVRENGKTQTYYAQYSYVGTWQSSGLTIHLNGINNSGLGEAVLDYGTDVTYKLVYEVSETDGYVCLYWPHDVYGKDALFGYFTYDTVTNTLLATLSDSNNTEIGYTQGNLFVIDDYNGEWICNDETFANIEFEFNGNGLYGFLYGYAGMEGKLTLLDLSTGKETVLTYTLDSTLKGHFAYNGLRYVMEYDEDLNAVKLTANGEEAQLQRKDALAGINFVDMDGVSYRFDGRSNLTDGGKLTVETAEGKITYAYFTAENGWNVVSDGETVGTVILDESKAFYRLTLQEETQNLYVYNQFIGEWAIGGEFAMLKIGPTDLNGTIQANFKGYNVELTTIEQGLLTFKYRENNMPITYYVFVVEDTVLGYDVLVLSQYTNLYSGNYSICTKAHELYGEWVSGNNEFTLIFDGITSGAYAYGAAQLYRNTPSYTAYSYHTTKHGIILWSQTVLGGKTQYYKIVPLNVEDLTEAELGAVNVFLKKDADGNIIAAFKRVLADGILFVEAVDDAGNDYLFDGENANGNLGHIYVNGEVKYTYRVTEYVNEDTVKLVVTDIKTNVSYQATILYPEEGDNLFILGEIIENQAN